MNVSGFNIIGFALLCGLAGVGYSLATIYWVLKQDTGTPRMQEINAAVLEGGNAFLNREYKTAAVVGLVLFGLLFALGKYVAVGFLIGAIGSAVCGWIGMQVAIRSNVRVAQAAFKGMSNALAVAFRAGS